MGRRFAVVALVALTASTVVVFRPTHSRRRRALIYGDSLVWESEWSAKKEVARAGWVPVFRVFPTQAPCDWLPTLKADLAKYRPATVTIETAGSSDTPCMAGVTLNSAAYFARYRADLTRLFRIASASGARVTFFASPPMSVPAVQRAVSGVLAIATSLAQRYNVAVVSTGHDGLARDGAYVAYKPCLANETAPMGCVHGRIAVRTSHGGQAGIHLCPVGLPAVYPGFCRVYSSGEFRFGTALAKAAT